jgi:hypothetical protein
MTPGKIINSQTREVIAKVMKFMKEEATNGIQIPVANFKARVLAATGIGRIQKEAQRVAIGEIPKFTSPKKNRKRATPKSDLQEGEIQAIRSIIHNFCITEKRQPTLRGTCLFLIFFCNYYFTNFLGIYQKIIDSGIEFRGKLTTLATVINKMGFKYVKICLSKLYNRNFEFLDGKQHQTNEKCGKFFSSFYSYLFLRQFPLVRYAHSWKLSSKQILV